MSLFSFSSRGGGSGRALFFCVSGVVTNARSAHTVGASVEELTCLIGINGGDVLYFHHCTLGNINTPASPFEHTFCGTTG